MKNPSNFKIWLKWDALKVYGFGPFWDPGYCWKTKNLLEFKISANTTSLGISNNVNARSQNNHRILVKLSKKKLGTQIGSNLPPWGCAKALSEILTYVIAPSIYTFWMTHFSCWIFAVLNFTMKKQLFLWFMNLLDPFS